jgi:hypothetical protein
VKKPCSFCDVVDEVAGDYQGRSYCNLCWYTNFVDINAHPESYTRDTKTLARGLIRIARALGVKIKKDETPE